MKNISLLRISCAFIILVLPFLLSAQGIKRPEETTDPEVRKLEAKAISMFVEQANSKNKKVFKKIKELFDSQKENPYNRSFTYPDKIDSTDIKTHFIDYSSWCTCNEITGDTTWNYYKEVLKLIISIPYADGANHGQLQPVNYFILCTGDTYYKMEKK